jgi:hypothetical protein
VLTHVRPTEVVVIADLDTLLIALYVELTDQIIPSSNLVRRGPGRPPHRGLHQRRHRLQPGVVLALFQQPRVWSVSHAGEPASTVRRWGRRASLISQVAESHSGDGLWSTA